MEYGKKVKARREALRLTVGELAKRSGEIPLFLMDLEDGRCRGISSKSMSNIANALETTVDDLFFGVSDDMQREYNMKVKAIKKKLATMDSGRIGFLYAFCCK